MTDTTDAAATPRPERPMADLLEELHDIERHLREVPPHAAGGGTDLAGRRETLQREIARRRAADVDRP